MSTTLTAPQAYRGFHLRAAGATDIYGEQSTTGAFLIKQGIDTIIIPESAITTFKKAVADVGPIT